MAEFNPIAQFGVSSIDPFLAYINQYSDVARADKFNVVIPIAQGLLSSYGSDTTRLSFQCESAELPGRTLSTFDARTYGVHKKYPYETTYNPLILTFICTGNRASLLQQLVGLAGSSILSSLFSIAAGASGMWEKAFFDDWMEVISPTNQSVPFGQYMFNYKDNYAVDITVNHYDSQGNLTYQALAKECFPYAVNNLNLNWSDDSNLKLTVEFAYTNWIRVTAPNSIPWPPQGQSTSLASVAKTLTTKS